MEAKKYKILAHEKVPEGCKVIAYRYGELEIVCDKKINESDISVDIDKEQEYTRDKLEILKYKELQKIAKKLGVNHKGKKVEIIERILNKL